MPSWCGQHVCELLSEHFMGRKGVVFNSGTSAAPFLVWEHSIHCRERLNRGIYCLHVSSCSHFMPQIFSLVKCPSQSLLPNPGVQLLRPAWLSALPAGKFLLPWYSPLPSPMNCLPFVPRRSGSGGKICIAQIFIMQCRSFSLEL